MPPIGRGWAAVALGVALVTFATPALTTVALFRIDLSIYTALISTGALWSLPIGRCVKKEPVGWRAVAGAVLTVAGVVPLALSAA